MSGFDELQVAVERGEREAVVSMVKDALDGGTDPADILNDGLIAAMQAVGEKMEEGDMFIPEVLRAAKTMQAGLEILAVSYTHLRAHETKANIVCRLLLEKKKQTTNKNKKNTKPTKKTNQTKNLQK